MQVMYIHRTRGGGVEGVHINGIIDSFTELGHKVDVISPEDPTKEEVNDEKQKKSVKSRLFDWISQHTPELIFELAEIAFNIVTHKQASVKIRENKYDFIYERYAIFAFAGVWLAKKYQIPLILEINYTSKSPLVRKRSRILSPLALAFDRWLFKNASCLSVVSSYLKDHIVNDFGIPDSKVIVIPNAADPLKFVPENPDPKIRASLGIKAERVVGFVGGFYPWHGVDLLLDAFYQVSVDMDELILLLVGDGPEKEAIFEKVNLLNLENRVIFTGKVEHNKLPALISQFDVGVMPDSNVYGSPMKIFEYMAQGKAVVVPDYGPLLDVVEHGKQGFIFEKKNSSSLAEAFKTLLNDSAQLEQLSINARKSVEMKHNWKQNAKLNLEYITSHCGH